MTHRPAEDAAVVSKMQCWLSILQSWCNTVPCDQWVTQAKAAHDLQVLCAILGVPVTPLSADIDNLPDSHFPDAPNLIALQPFDCSAGQLGMQEHASAAGLPHTAAATPATAPAAAVVAAPCGVGACTGLNLGSEWTTIDAPGAGSSAMMPAVVPNSVYTDATVYGPGGLSAPAMHHNGNPALRKPVPDVNTGAAGRDGPAIASISQQPTTLPIRSTAGATVSTCYASSLAPGAVPACQDQGVPPGSTSSGCLPPGSTVTVSTPIKHVNVICGDVRGVLDFTDYPSAGSCRVQLQCGTWVSCTAFERWRVKAATRIGRHH
eukprot:jgi/Chrzof1/14669/Cz09g11140.t1